MRSRYALISVVLCLCVQTACDDKKTSPAAMSSASASVSSSSSSAMPSASADAAASAPASSASAAPFVVPVAITAQHILIAYKGAKGTSKAITRTKADAKKRAEEVLAKAKSDGSDFTALVMEYSDDPGSKERSGSVGKFTRDKMTKPFSDAAFALRVDEISNIVETDFGFHIIKRNQ